MLHSSVFTHKKGPITTIDVHPMHAKTSLGFSRYNVWDGEGKIEQLERVNEWDKDRMRAV